MKSPNDANGHRSAPTRRPNLLLLFPDQHRGDWIGFHGAAPVRTLNVDALAARGVAFTHALCPSPLFAPSRAVLATGREDGRNPEASTTRLFDLIADPLQEHDLAAARPHDHRRIQEALCDWASE